MGSKKTDEEMEPGLGEDFDWKDEDDETEEPHEEEEVETVARPLNQKAVLDRQLELASTTTALLNLEDKRTTLNKKINVKLKEMKKDIRRLAQEIENKAERVPAQQELIPAKQARRKVQRAAQDNGAAVEP